MIKRLTSVVTLVLANSLVVEPVLAAAQAAAATAAPHQQMTCEPSLVRPGDTLKITLPYPHGPYLTVREPNARPGYYLFLTVPFRTQTELGASAISGDRFQRMRTLDIVVSKTKAIPWVYEAKPRLIFKRRGKYFFQLGDQFETEAKIVESTCTVEFQP